MKTKIEVAKIYSHQGGVAKGRTKDYYNEFQKEVHYQLREQFKCNEDDFIEIELTFYLQIPKSIAGKKLKQEARQTLEGRPCNVKLDLDNTAKGIMDILAKCYRFDDKQVTNLKLSKFFVKDCLQKNEEIEIKMKTKGE